MSSASRLTCDSSYESINWLKANLNSFYRLHHLKLHQVIVLCASSFLRFALFSPKTAIAGDFLITQSSFRKDLNDDFQLIAQKLSPKYLLMRFRSYDRFCFPVVGLSEFKLAWRISIKIANEWDSERPQRAVRILFFLRVLEGLKFLDQLDREASTPKAVLATMEMQFFENLFVQWANLRGGVTYGYQHGYYIDSGPSVTAHSTNPTNYLANVSQFVMIWGEKSKLVYDKYSKTKYLSVGKVSTSSLGGKAGKVKNKFDGPLNFVVLLDSYLQLSANLKILTELAKCRDENTSLHYIKHPDDSNDYSSLGEEMTHSMVESSRHLIFGNNSSVVLQYGILGFDVCLYEKSNFIGSSTAITAPNVEYQCFGAVKFAYFNCKTSSDFWKSFICATGEECLAKIKEHL